MYCNRDMTVVFIGFDGYSDLWGDCFRLYNMFWPDRSFRTIFVNNIKDFSFEGIDVLHAGASAEWSAKVQVALKEATTPYICLLLEDFFVGNTVDDKTVVETVSYVKKNNIKYCKLVDMNRPFKNRQPNYKGIRFLHTIPESDEYGISLQASIWDRSFLANLLGNDNYNAWKFEFNRVKESLGKRNVPVIGCVTDERNILNLKHGVIQGKYLPNTVKYFKGKGIELNLHREVMSYRQYFKLHFIARGKYFIPRKLRGTVKKMFEKLGMKFVSTVRDN